MKALGAISVMCHGHIAGTHCDLCAIDQQLGWSFYLQIAAYVIQALTQLVIFVSQSPRGTVFQGRRESHGKTVLRVSQISPIA